MLESSPCTLFWKRLCPLISYTIWINTGNPSPQQMGNSTLNGMLEPSAWSGHSFKPVSFPGPFLLVHLHTRWQCPWGSVWALCSAQGMQSLGGVTSICGSGFHLPAHVVRFALPALMSPGTPHMGVPQVNQTPQIQITTFPSLLLHCPWVWQLHPQTDLGVISSSSPSLSPPSLINLTHLCPLLHPRLLPFSSSPENSSGCLNGFFVPSFVLLQIHANKAPARS